MNIDINDLFLNKNTFDEDVYNSTNNRSIVMWVVVNGRKKVTFISGWDLPENELKEHIRNIKKTNGCNGTLNKDKEGDGYIIQFQGNMIDPVKKYMSQHNIDINSIYVKGQE